MATDYEYAHGQVQILKDLETWYQLPGWQHRLEELEQQKEQVRELMINARSWDEFLGLRGKLNQIEFEIGRPNSIQEEIESQQEAMQHALALE